MVQLELLEVNNGVNIDYVVRLLYYGQERIIFYCSVFLCLLIEFSDYIKEIVLLDFKIDCKVINLKIMNGLYLGCVRRV